MEHFKKFRNMNAWYLLMFGKTEETQQIGLFFEFTRFIFSVFPEVYDFHFNLVSDPRNELKMEVFHSDFDRNLNVILDRLNLIDSPENREILRRSGLSDVDILRERDALYSLLKTQDASLVEPTNNAMDSIKEEPLKIQIPRNLHKVGFDAPIESEDRRALMSEFAAGHIHRGRNDTKYIGLLLGIDPVICLLLKHITNLIEYGWSYSNYC